MAIRIYNSSMVVPLLFSSVFVVVMVVSCFRCFPFVRPVDIADIVMSSDECCTDWIRVVLLTAGIIDQQPILDIAGFRNLDATTLVSVLDKVLAGVPTFFGNICASISRRELPYCLARTLTIVCGTVDG